MLKKITQHHGDFMEVLFQPAVPIDRLQKAVEKEGHYELGGTITISGSAERMVPVYIKPDDRLDLKKAGNNLNIATIKLEGNFCKSIFFTYTNENKKLIKELDARLSPFLAPTNTPKLNELLDEGTRATLKKICETGHSPEGQLILFPCKAISCQHTLDAIRQCGGSVASYKKGVYAVSKEKGKETLCVITTPSGFRRHTVTFPNPEDDLELIKNFVNILAGNLRIK